MQKIAAVYQQIEQRFARCVRSKQVATDAYLEPNSCKVDARRGLTLLCRLDTDIATAILQTIETLKPFLGEQYVQAANDLHTTVYSVIPTAADYPANDPVVSRCIDAVAAAVKDQSDTLQIEYRGIIASNDALIVMGYPTTTSVQRLRAAILVQMTERDLASRFNLRYPMVTAHATLVRFIQQPNDLSALNTALKNLREKPFGTSLITRLELTEHDWYVRSASLTPITEYELAAR